MNGSASPDGELRPDAVELQLLMHADARTDAAAPSAPTAPITTLSMIPMADTSRLIMSVASAIHAPMSSNSYVSGGGTRHSTLPFGAGADFENSFVGSTKLKESSDDSALFRHSLRSAREPRGAVPRVLSALFPPCPLCLCFCLCAESFLCSLLFLGPVISQSGLTTLSNRGARGTAMDAADSDEVQGLSTVDSDFALGSSQSNLRHVRNPSLPTRFMAPAPDSGAGRQQASASSGYSTGDSMLAPSHPTAATGPSGTPSSVRQQTARSGPLRLLDRFTPRVRAAPGYSPLSDRDTPEISAPPLLSSPSRRKGVLQDVWTCLCICSPLWALHCTCWVLLHSQQLSALYSYKFSRNERVTSCIQINSQIQYWLVRTVLFWAHTFYFERIY